MAEVRKEGRITSWVNPDGYDVPIRYIDKDDQNRDKLVTDIFGDVYVFVSDLSSFKVKLAQMVDAYLDSLAGKHNEKWKGNAVIMDFAEKHRIDVSISDKISFDNKLQIAKSKIDTYIKSLVKNAGKEIVMLINKAFNVDKKGNVDVKQILSLRSLKIEHPEWQEAMDLISEAIRIDSTKRYFNFKEKQEDGSWKSITLNFSAL
jgi:hypothetical protein